MDRHTPTLGCDSNVIRVGLYVGDLQPVDNHRLSYSEALKMGNCVGVKGGMRMHKDLDLVDVDLANGNRHTI